MGNKKKERAKARKAGKIAKSNEEQNVRQALECEDAQIMLHGCETLCQFDLGANNIGHIKYYTKTTLPPSFKYPLFEVFRNNMESQYRKNWGFREAEKKAEMFSDQSRYLIATTLSRSSNEDKDKEESILGFIHLRFTVDEDEEPAHVGVCYIYEIQILPSLQRRGLGRRLMEVVEHMARTWKMKKMKLTVFKDNAAAIDFYRKKLGYVIDGSSPSKWGLEKECYEILSKVLLPEMDDAKAS